jgi:hypothetical protein
MYLMNNMLPRLEYTHNVNPLELKTTTDQVISKRVTPNLPVHAETVAYYYSL